MSPRDSGTKSWKFLRVLVVLALAFTLLTTTGVMALAAGEPEASVTQSEVSAETSVPPVEDEVASTETGAFKSGYSNLDPDAPLGEKFMYGLQVAGIGMAVVFMVLIIIMAILYVFKLFATAGSKKPAQAPKAAPAAPVAPVASTEDEQTIVAVATAAIAAERGESACAFNVISITKLQ